MTQTVVDVRPKFEVSWQDIEYREGLLARVYRPLGSGPFPALIEIHGGAWSSGDRTQNADLVQALAASGLVVASVEFRLGGQAPYPANMADINYATRWLKSRAQDFGASADALGGLGLSSGGHMVMLSAMRPRDPRYTAFRLDSAPGVDASLAYVMMGWPVLDPHARYLHARQQGRTDLLDAHHRYFGDEQTMREANPQQILERGEAVDLPPALIFQGADGAAGDVPGEAEQADAFGTAERRALIEALDILDERGRLDRRLGGDIGQSTGAQDLEDLDHPRIDLGEQAARGEQRLSIWRPDAARAGRGVRLRGADECAQRERRVQHFTQESLHVQCFSDADRLGHQCGYAEDELRFGPVLGEELVDRMVEYVGVAEERGAILLIAVEKHALPRHQDAIEYRRAVHLFEARSKWMIERRSADIEALATDEAQPGRSHRNREREGPRVTRSSVRA